MEDDIEIVSKHGADTNAAAESLALAGASRARADAYLDEQIGLSRLQRDNLIEQNAFELSHLKWRRFNDQMKGAMQIMAVALGLFVVVGIAAAVWNASQADGLVVDPFAVSPQIAASGISGDMVAGDVTSKLIVIRNIANANSVGSSKDVQQDSGNDIKVEIPDTGISVAEAWRYLRSWLGHERHLRGSLRLMGDKTVVLMLNGADVTSFTGSPADLDKLEQSAAEHVFASADAAQYVVYLSVSNRHSEALAVAARIAQASTENRADLYALWANEISLSDPRRALTVARFAKAIDPKVATPYLEAIVADEIIGHDEDVLQQCLAVLSLKDSDQPAYERGAGFSQMRDIAAVNRDRRTADFNRAFSEAAPFEPQASQITQRAGYAARLYDGARVRALIADAQVAGVPDGADLARARYFVAMTAADWQAAVDQARLFAAALKAEEKGGAGRLRTRTQAVPLLAAALAKSGDLAGARAAIATTPLDCYDCVVKRGDVETAARDWAAAERWFAQAVKQAPSLPFAYADWGQMLTMTGDLDGAIAKFESAHRKGPHFADPLEMWGEALIAKNRSDLAVAKFEEANRYAPNWGRLHLKWGEALWWSGQKDEAKRQFAIASALDFTPSEKSELERISHGG